jgi:hypothetical protein
MRIPDRRSAVSAQERMNSPLETTKSTFVDSAARRCAASLAPARPRPDLRIPGYNFTHPARADKNGAVPRRTAPFLLCS